MREKKKKKEGRRETKEREGEREGREGKQVNVKWGCLGGSVVKHLPLAEVTTPGS